MAEVVIPEEEYIEANGWMLYYNVPTKVEVGFQWGWSIEPYLWLDVKENEIVVWFEHGDDFKRWIFKGKDAHKAEKLFYSLVKKAEKIAEEGETHES